MLKTWLIAAFAGLGAVSLAACEDNDVEDAADDVADEIEEAGEEAEDAVEDAADEAEDETN